MFKVCHISTVHPLYDVRIFHKECKLLKAKGYHVYFIVTNSKDEEIDGIKIISLPKSRSRIQRYFKNGFLALKKALKLNADIYHFHDPEFIPMALVLCLLGRCAVYDVHEDYPRSIGGSSRPYFPKSIAKYLRKIIALFIESLENFAAKRFSAIVAATPFIGGRFKSLNSRTIVLNNYPKRDELKPFPGFQWNQRKPVVIYLGTISPLRGLLEMVEAMSHIPNEIPIRLEIAGDYGRVSAQVRQRVESSQGWDKVRILGRVDRVQVNQLFNRAQVGLVLLHKTPSYFNSRPVKLFEYMSAGIPVIASDFPIWREIVGGIGCGISVDPLDTQAIARAIIYLITKPKEAEAMGRLGRYAIEKKYNWELEVGKLYEIYSDLLSGKPHYKEMPQNK